MISTKSIQAPRDPNDGIRICIMRQPPEGTDYDMWIPHLSPPLDLLEAYTLTKTIAWEEFKEKFKSVLQSETKYLEIVLDIAKRNNVTLLCMEENPEKCHRRLVLVKLKEMQPNFEFVLK